MKTYLLPLRFSKNLKKILKNIGFTLSISMFRNIKQTNQGTHLKKEIPMTLTMTLDQQGGSLTVNKEAACKKILLEILQTLEPVASEQVSKMN